ncbi:MAG: nitrous oxide reductase accessory protein NosL [Phycisphaeraceae bacterium]|nr:MAG: nitrous oxide reductase accessory protein NosL [Phycisphaeraceae bacterium]
MNGEASGWRLILTAMALLACVAGVLAPGCVRGEVEGPPVMRPGRDACVACGMLIHEDRCAAAWLIERDGVREHEMFDDLGCLLDHERLAVDPPRVVGRWARDYERRGWVACERAVYVFSDPDRLLTPMGSGIVAFEREEDARGVIERFGGEVMGFDRLVTARREWMEARYGKPR